MVEIPAELQEKILLYQLLHRSLDELQQQALILQQRVLELEATRVAVTESSKLPKNNQLLIPLGSGCYVSGRATQTSSLLVNVGAGVVLKKSPKDVLALLEERAKEIQNLLEKVQLEMLAATAKINEIAPEIEALAKESES